MRARATLYIIVFLVGITSCRNDDFGLQNPDVDKFISLLKSGEYMQTVGADLPEFSEAHLEKLVNYLDDTTRLSSFPANPISSKYTHPKILNECVFWTIDGIRLGRKNPSLEPSLRDTTTFERLSTVELLQVSALYKAWYDEYKNQPSAEIKTKAILKNTPYRWD